MIAAGELFLQFSRVFPGKRSSRLCRRSVCIESDAMAKLLQTHQPSSVISLSAFFGQSPMSIFNELSSGHLRFARNGATHHRTRPWL